MPAMDGLEPVLALLRDGRRADAESACMRLLEADHDHAEAWQLLGSLRLDRGDAGSALDALRKAAGLRPHDARVGLLHAVAAFRAGDPERALGLLADLVGVHPDDAGIVFHHALLVEQAGDLAAAASGYSSTLDLDPGNREARLRLGFLCVRLGKPAEARSHLEAVYVTPRFDLAVPLARACLALGDLATAHDYATDAAKLAPHSMDGWLLQGIALRQARRASEAKAALNEALARAPRNPLVLIEAGCNLREIGEFAAGQALLASAMELAPELPATRWLHDLGVPMVPADAAEAAVAVDAYCARIDRLVADLDNDVGDLRASALEGILQSAPFALHYLPVPVLEATWRYADLAACVSRHVFGASHAGPCAWRALQHGGRVRVGFVSAEVRVHTITRYFGRWLEELDVDRFEMHVWHLGNESDALTERVAARAHGFHPAFAQSIEELVDSIRSARLDVLVYLEIGMEGRQAILGSLRLAPVQCVAFGHPVSTGLAAIDWFLSSDCAEPAGAQAHYRERLERLPGLGVAFEPPPAPGDGTWLAREPDRPLLLCLQSLFKLVPAFDELVARIVAATDAMLVFFESPLALGERFLARIGARLAAHGLDPQRHLVLLERRSHADYLGGIAAADLVLDSIGFCGGATSLDALSVGTPLVTLEGEFMRGRQGAAMLRLIGADALVATTPDDYVHIAIDLCRDATRRGQWREHLLRRAPELFAHDDAVPAFEAFLVRAANEAAATAA